MLADGCCCCCCRLAWLRLADVVRFLDVELFNDGLPRLAPADFARPGEREAAFFVFPAVFSFSGDLERARVDDFILPALIDALLADAALAALVLADFTEVARPRFIGDLERSRPALETSRFIDDDLARTAALAVLPAAARFGLVDDLRGGAIMLYSAKQRR